MSEPRKETPESKAAIVDELLAQLYEPLPCSKQKARTIIQSAIEKVDNIWRERFRKFEEIEDKFGPSKQREAAQPNKP